MDYERIDSQLEMEILRHSAQAGLLEITQSEDAEYFIAEHQSAMDALEAARQIIWEFAVLAGSIEKERA